MSVPFQILLGSGILICCTMIHIGVMIWIVRFWRNAVASFKKQIVEKTFLATSAMVFTLLASHTVHVYFWAVSFWVLGALPGPEEPIYFALVTYTTVGYGDVTLGPAFRIFGAMASVNGILAFGLTTAFLVAIIPRIFSALKN